MKAHRIWVGIAVGFLGFGLTAGTANALEGCDFSATDCDGGGGGGGGGSRSSSTKPKAEVLPTSETVPTTTPAETSPELAFTPDEEPATSGGTLPFTGGDVLELTAVGVGALAIGTVMVRRGRRQTAS